RWSKASSGTLDEIESSLGFEGDCQVGIFDSVPVISLDDRDRRDPTKYAENRLKDFEAFVKAHPVAPDESDLLDRLYHGAKDRDRQARNYRKPDRDIKFASRLQLVIGSAPDDRDGVAYSEAGQNL